MAIIKMDMCSYEVERGAVLESGCGDECVKASWEPALQLQQIGLVERRTELPAELAGANVECFLERMYSFQS
jgi:hypothetical protein